MPKPIGKYKPYNRIDNVPRNPFGGTGPDADASSGMPQVAPPVAPIVPPPTITSMTGALEYSAVTPSAAITIVWTNLETNDLETYRVQIATNAGFTANLQTFATSPNVNSTTIGGRAVNTVYYARVQTIVGNTASAWSSTFSTTTPLDTTVPSVPTSPAVAFQGIGDLVVTWTNSTSSNYKNTEIKIWDSSSKTILYGTFYNASERFIWTAAQNLAATSGVGDPTVYVELKSQSYGAIFSAAVVAGTATKSAPSTPGTITHSWSGDTGTAGADWTISWASQSDAAYYLLNINALGARRIPANTYTYALSKNIADNTSADPTLSYSLVAVDGLNQSSTAATGTATNAAPPAPTVGIEGHFDAAVVQITGTKAFDFLAYELVWKRDGTTVLTIETPDNKSSYDTTHSGDEGSHLWSVVVRQKDVFGQYSSTTTSSSVTIDALTIGGLRAGALYSDSDSNTFTPPASGTLAALKDDNVSSGGVTYAA